MAKPQAIEKEVEFLSQNPQYGLVVGYNEIIDSDNNVCYWDKNKNNIYDINQAVYKTFGELLKQVRHDIDFNSKIFGDYNSLYLGNYIPNGYLLRKEVLNDIHFVQDAPLEDYYLMLQIAKKYKFKYIDEVLYSYRWHSTNTVKQIKKFFDKTKKTQEYEEKILANIDKKAVLSDVINVQKYGAILRRRGIKYLFEIVFHRKNNVKIRVVKLFNIPILKFKKIK